MGLLVSVVLEKYNTRPKNRDKDIDKDHYIGI